ncbi:(d)CMP kinase [Planctomicrobium piriforme]|uniref:Cytidylate kinase n=1 Tax=Planctomicrobium piriforme TaxID=1576369 RepID=A0A1I3B7U7_9PLAN|nr:(d)CMP kinase [Planctomicrobium piriforme]SFH58373.1 cytidylate kinase [Planctomicrobium piriforme]
MIVTIDGPAGTGKSTVARRLAEQLRFQFLDTGAMYRMIALKALREQIDPGDQSGIGRLARETVMDLTDGGYLMDGVEVGGEIRTAEVTKAASLVAQIPAVRELLVRRQREIASARNIVCEGRDQGTVAFPHAECKFFLTAQPEERARRRLEELAAQGSQVDFEELLREQSDRDQRDQERAVAPLRPAADALLVDTTALDLDQVVRLLREQILVRVQSAAAQ